MVWIAYSIISTNNLDLKSFDTKINKTHPWLIGSKCIKFHEDRCNAWSGMVRKPSYGPETIFNHQCPMTKGHMLHSPGAGVWRSDVDYSVRFGNHFRLSMLHDLYLWLFTLKSIGQILDSLSVSVWSFITISQKVSDLQPETNCWCRRPAREPHIRLGAEFWNSTKMCFQETLTPPRHLVSHLVCRGPWLSTVVLYCWCHSDSVSVLLYFLYICLHLPHFSKSKSMA